MRVVVKVGLVLVATFGWQAEIHAGILLTPIAHSSDGFVGASFDRGLSVPTMNNLGQVAFRGRTANGTVAVYVGNGVTRKVIADSNGPFPGISSHPPGIADDGTVVFRSNIPGGNSGTRLIAKGKLNAATNDVEFVVGRNSALPGSGVRAGSSGDFAPSVNNRGEISVAQTTVFGPAGVYRFGASVNEIVGPSHHPLGGTSINDQGIVAFQGDMGRTIYLGDGVTLRSIVDISLLDGSLRFDMPDLNNRGELVFYAGDGFSGGFDGIYHYDGVNVAQKFGNTANVHFEVNAFEDLFPGINDLGNIAGLAHVRVANGGFAETLFVDDPITGKIVSVGDDLFGRTVSDLDFYRAINNRGQVAFFARFTDGSEGIYRADVEMISAVPEPGSICSFVMLIGLVTAASVWRRRKTRDRTIGRSLVFDGAFHPCR